MSYVFVSHANADKPRLLPILRMLLDAGTPLWIDKPADLGLSGHPLVMESVGAGDGWDAQIRDAYQTADCVLFFLTEETNSPARSDLLFREFEHAAMTDKLVIVQLDRIEPSAINGLMRIRQAIDLIDFDPAARPGGGPNFHLLVTQLRKRLERTQAKGESREKSPVTGKQFLKLLPYLCDRRLQKRRFATVIQEQLDQGDSRPLFFAVVGNDRQCADKFVEELYAVSLPRVLEANGLDSRVEDKLLRWPTEPTPGEDTDDMSQFLADLEFELKDRLDLRLTPGTRQIQHRLDQRNGAVFLYFDVNLSKWTRKNSMQLKAMLDWWGRFDFSERRYPVIWVGRFCCPGGGIWPFAARGVTRRAIRAMSSLQQDPGSKVRTLVLPQLGDVTREDLSSWVAEHDAFADYHTQDVLPRLRRFFSGPLGLGERRVPMAEAALFLRQLLEDMNIEIERSRLETAA